ncbi:YnbE family lipoprotein [Sphingomonas jatrophae]
MLTTGRAGATPAAMRLIPAGAACLLAGCISVKAPEKPIEINLNVNIRQEVVVSLRRDVQDLDKQFPGVF